MTLALLALLLMAAPGPSRSLREMGDEEFARIHYPLAQALYDSALAMAPDSDAADILWRLARVAVCQADVSPPEEKPARYRVAEAFAERCIVADSLKSEGHTWRAAALGNIAMFEGSRAKVDLCNTIKSELECSIRLNARDDIAYSILGSFYMALGNVSWLERRLAAALFGALPEGGFEDAEGALKKAIALAPHVIRHHFELGDLYMQQDRQKEALEEFRKVLSSPVLLASDRRTQESAAERVQELNASPL